MKEVRICGLFSFVASSSGCQLPVQGGIGNDDRANDST